MIRASISVILFIKSVVFFKLEYFICMLAEVSCDLQRNDGRGHIATCLNEVDGLPRYADSVRQLLLGYVLYGSFYLYRILHA